MRIHEVLEQSLTQYMQELTESFEIEGLSWYNYRRPAKPQQKRAMKVARKASTRTKKTAGKVRRVANKAVNAAAIRGQKQQALQKQKQATQAQQTAAKSAAYNPIKYQKPMVLPRKQAVAQPQPVQQARPTPAPASVNTKVGSVHDLQDLGAQAHMILPKDKRGTPPWELHND